ncbi:cytochrome c oxidase assembly factor 5-like protein [Dissophora ornata]|nr:cytochrome c oxidase assembly factor 5-like protein [Dissophora ornata]
MPSSCKEIRAELAECILKSNCVLVDGLSPKECLRSENEYRVPSECTAIKRSFFECKRGMLDMRTRFRGNKS